MKRILLLAFLITLSAYETQAQLNRYKYYDFSSDGMMAKWRVVVMEKEGQKEVFLEVGFKDKGLLLTNYSHVTFSEVVMINEAMKEISFEAINDEKSKEDVKKHFITASGFWAGYEVFDRKITWYIGKDVPLQESKIIIDRDRLLALFQVAVNRMNELSK